MKLLLIEDSLDLCDMLTQHLRNSFYEVDTCHDGIEGLTLLESECYDLIILDLNLPGLNGMDVLKQLRDNDPITKVLILSARSHVSDKVAGLDAGANDFLSKPFHIDELDARIRSLTNRDFIQKDSNLVFDSLSLDRKTHEVNISGISVDLTKKEFILLEYLMLNQGRPVSQEELIEHCWDSSVDTFSNSVRVHISALRKKIKATAGKDMITNRIGEGYMIGGQQNDQNYG